MDVYFENKYKDDRGRCYILLFFVRVLVISSPTITDLVLSIISFDPECMSYFVLNYVTIFFSILCYIIGCFLPLFEEDEGESCATCGLVGICVFIVVLGLEIAVLVIFINDYQILDLLAIIGYFIQWIPIIVLIIVLIVFQCK